MGGTGPQSWVTWATFGGFRVTRNSLYSLARPPKPLSSEWKEHTILQANRFIDPAPLLMRDAVFIGLLLGVSQFFCWQYTCFQSRQNPWQNFPKKYDGVFHQLSYNKSFGGPISKEIAVLPLRQLLKRYLPSWIITWILELNRRLNLLSNTYFFQHFLFLN